MDRQQQQPALGTMPTAAAPATSQSNQNLAMGQVPILAPPPPMPPHMMTFPSNAAMASGNPLFPPPVMLSNGTFLAMPDIFSQGQGAAAAQPQPGMMPRIAAVLGNQAVANGFNGVPGATPQVSQTNPAPSVQVNNTNPPVQAPAMPQPTMPPAAAPTATTLGGVPIPALPPHSSTAMQVQVAAAAAAAAAAPLKSAQKGGVKKESAGARGRRSDLSTEEKAKQNRDRNREHARSTRLRKKAYVQKLKELVDGLHAERTEEVRKRRVAVQHVAEVQNVRRAVVRTFLGFHSSFESDPRKWMTILEDTFWFKQPVTPYRSFRRVEIEQECRVSRGVDAMIADAASISVMVEGIGSRSTRWMQIKREDFLVPKEARDGSSSMPQSIVRENSRLQHAVSSLSSSSGSSNGSGTDEDKQSARRQQIQALQPGLNIASAANLKKQVTAGSGSSGDSLIKQKPSNDFHDYHAPSLPDPMLDSGGSSPGSDSPSESRKDPSGANGSGTKHVSTDSSSGDEDKLPSKRRKLGIHHHAAGSAPTAASVAPQSAGVTAAISHNTINGRHAAPRHGLPPNIAKSGGISHSVRPISSAAPSANAKSVNPRLNTAPAIAVPPFAGIGKRAPMPQAMTTATVGAALIDKGASSVSVGGAVSVPASTTAGQTALRSTVVSLSVDSVPSNGAATPSVTGSAPVISTDETSSNSSNHPPQIQAYYHVNEDDMLLTDDVLMCPFIFRSQDAVMCGALAECIMPGMLRAHFSPRNKLMSLEMVYDSMGFMQQLERASGTEGAAQIVPSSLEMALSPNTNEARVITLAKPPFLIVSVNEAWTRTTKYTQMEVEGKQLSLLNGKKSDPEAGVRSGKPVHKFEEVAQGRCACSVNIHYDKEERPFVDFVCSYPLTNANDDITHILHVSKPLPEPANSSHEFADSN